MAEITVTFPEGRAGSRATALWETMDGSDTGEWIELLDFNDNTVTVSGTFDSNTLTMQGANLADKSDAFTLTDNNGFFQLDSLPLLPGDLEYYLNDSILEPSILVPLVESDLRLAQNVENVILE